MKHLRLNRISLKNYQKKEITDNKQRNVSNCPNRLQPPLFAQHSMIRYLQALPKICRHGGSGSKLGNTNKHSSPPAFPRVHCVQFSDYQIGVWGLVLFACTESLAGAGSTFT